MSAVQLLCVADLPEFLSMKKNKFTQNRIIWSAIFFSIKKNQFRRRKQTYFAPVSEAVGAETCVIGAEPSVIGSGLSVSLA